jgi:hypothetical protein
MKAQALEYALRGWAVMACQARSKEPNFSLMKRAYLSATTDTEQIEAMFELLPDTNIGIAVSTSGLIVIDIDYRNGGSPLPVFEPTYTVSTGDGLHLYYRTNPANSFYGKYADGIDIKHKGYVVAAPSIHPNGKTYTVIDGRDPIELPAAIYQRIIKTELVAA